MRVQQASDHPVVLEQVGGAVEFLLGGLPAAGNEKRCIDVGKEAEGLAGIEQRRSVKNDDAIRLAVSQRRDEGAHARRAHHLRGVPLGLAGGQDDQAGEAGIDEEVLQVGLTC